MSSRIDPAVRESIEELFAKRHARGAAPSCVWGIFDRDGLAASGSTGELNNGSTPTEHTAYRIASCTKSFTAAAILALRDRGALALDDPITRYIPSFSAVILPTADAPTPTIRMLLTMSAGFPTDNPWGDRQESMTADELDAFLARGVKFDTVPGTHFEYSNLGFALLGRVIEQAAGRPYREFIHELFIESLALTGTGFDSTVAAAGGVAGGTRWLDDHWDTLPFSGPGAFSPIGGLFSTVADLSRWAVWLAEAFDPSGSETCDSVLSRSSRRELQQLQRFLPERSEHPTGYGLGLFVEHYPKNETITSHSGGYPGFSAHMRWSQTTGIGVVAFENATGSRVAIAATEALDKIIAGREANAPIVWTETRAAQAEVTTLLSGWSDDIADSLFSENVALDVSLERRRLHAAKAIAQIGGLEPATPGTPLDEESHAPSHLVWHLPGNAGRLRVEIELTPENSPRIQTLKVTPDRA